MDFSRFKDFVNEKFLHKPSADYVTIGEHIEANSKAKALVSLMGLASTFETIAKKDKEKEQPSVTWDNITPEEAQQMNPEDVTHFEDRYLGKFTAGEFAARKKETIQNMLGEMNPRQRSLVLGEIKLIQEENEKIANDPENANDTFTTKTANEAITACTRIESYCDKAFGKENDGLEK